MDYLIDVKPLEDRGLTNPEIAGILSSFTNVDIPLAEVENFLDFEGLAARNAITGNWEGALVDVIGGASQELSDGVSELFVHLNKPRSTQIATTQEEWALKSSSLLAGLVAGGIITQAQADGFVALGGGLRHGAVTDVDVAQSKTDYENMLAQQEADRIAEEERMAAEAAKQELISEYLGHYNTIVASVLDGESPTKADIAAALRSCADTLEAQQMTALSGPIIFNNSTGNDNTSSGCGPSVAVTETITTVAASNSATVTSGTGYSVGDLMYIPSATGRKFNVIATISGTTITFDYVWDDSLTSVSAHIGGKRATLDNADSRLIFKDIGTNNAAIIQTETDQTLTSAIAATSTNVGVSAYIESADDTVKTITQTANAYHFAGGGGPLYLKKLKLDNSSSSKPASIFRWDNGVGYLNVHLEQCTLGDPTNTCVTVQSGGGSYRTRYQMNNCIVQNMTGSYAFDGTQGEELMTNNLFINNN